MRKTTFLFVIILVIILQNRLIAQTVYISGTFTGIEPSLTYQYKAQIGSLGTNISLVRCYWELDGVMPGVDPTYATGPTYGAVNGQINNVQWENTPNNTDPKWIKVTVSYRKDGYDQTPITYQTPITVKHIGAPGPLSIGGTSYSFGTTLNQNCGIANLAVTFPAVTTHPAAAVTYTWTYPPGWSGPATTTTPAAVVTTNQSGGGTLKVEAKRNDGTTKTYISINVSRPSPTITGLSSADSYWLLCNTSQTVSLTAQASGNSVTDKFVWTPAGGVKVNGSLSPQTILGTNSAAITASSQGTFTVQGYSTVCGTTSSNSILRYIYYGKPTLSGANQYLFEPTTNLWHCSVNPQYLASHNWSVISGDASISPTSFAAYVSSVNGGIVAVWLTNACGSTSEQYFTIPAASGMLMAYPNPATRNLTIQFKNTEIQEIFPESLSLIDENSGKVVRSIDTKEIFAKRSFVDGNKLVVDVENLPRGTYFLTATPPKGSKQEKQTVRLKLE